MVWPWLALACRALALAWRGLACLGLDMPCLALACRAWPWRAVALACLGLGMPCLGMSCLGLGMSCLGLGMPWLGLGIAPFKAFRESEAIGMAWPWHALPRHGVALRWHVVLGLGVPWPWHALVSACPALACLALALQGISRVRLLAA